MDKSLHGSKARFSGKGTPTLKRRVSTPCSVGRNPWQGFLTKVEEKMDKSNKDSKVKGENKLVIGAVLADQEFMLLVIEALQAKEEELTDVRDLEYK